MSDAESTVEAPVAASELSPGRLLAEARGLRKQTIAEVAQQLKLSVGQVEALEAGNYDALPGHVFVRGFVRNYARLMELDADALVAALALPKEHGATGAAIPHSEDIPFPDGRGPRWPIYAAAIAVLALAVLLVEFIFSGPPAAVVTTTPPKQGADSPSLVAPQPQSVPAAPAQAPDAAPSAPAATAPAAAEQASPAQEKRSGLADLQFVFNNQSWVEVRDREDRIVLSQLNPAGAMQRVQGQPPLNIVIGNARGVRLTYNGRAVDLAPHTNVDVARLTLE